MSKSKIAQGLGVILIILFFIISFCLGVISTMAFIVYAF